MTDLGFVHHYLPPKNGSSTILLLLHGTGGDENDLIPVGKALHSDAGILSVRGKVLEHGMNRFFRRFDEGVFDLEDLAFRTTELNLFLAAARAHYSLADKQIIAVGYSNGANIASSLIFNYPTQLQGAILLRAMSAYEPSPLPKLNQFPVLLCQGEHDRLIPKPNADRLIELFRLAEADVQTHWHQGGHELAQGDLNAARAWLAEQ